MTERKVECRLAKIVRTITVPPVMVCALLVTLFFVREDIFANGLQLFWSVFFLMIVPLLAYPLSVILPAFRAQGRTAQRKLAFVTNLVGFAGGVIYGLAAHVSSGLMQIFACYFLSVVALIVFNKGLKLRASGHACSITGPLVLMTYFIGWVCLLPCIAVFAAIVWSSLALGRHTPKELLFGSFCALTAFALSMPIALL